MPKSSDVQQDDVFKACDAVRDSGERVTFARVYKQMGNKGGSKVVQGYIAEWLDRENNRLLPGLPDSFSERIRQLAVTAWDECLGIARGELDGLRGEMEEAIKSSRDSVDRIRLEAGMQVHDAEVRAKSAEATLAGARVEAQQQSERIHAQAIELASLREALAAANAKVTSLEGELARTRQDADDHRMDMQAQIDRIEEAYRGLERKSLEDIEDARADTRNVRSELEKRLAAQTEAAERRDAANLARIEELASALAGARTEAEQNKKRAEQQEADSRNSMDLLTEARTELARISSRAAAVEEYRQAESARAESLASEVKRLQERLTSDERKPKQPPPGK
ncbi:MAG: DNA-binding protein [Rhodocyclaceae bacterium]|nr:DNA-binding protein [Rhodocyclaceae bacterium]